MSITGHNLLHPRYKGLWGHHGAHLGPTGPRRPHVVPANFAIWDVMDSDYVIRHWLWLNKNTWYHGENIWISSGHTVALSGTLHGVMRLCCGIVAISIPSCFLEIFQIAGEATLQLFQPAAVNPHSCQTYQPTPIPRRWHTACKR